MSKMTRAIRWLGWQASHLIASQCLGTPNGWTLCGVAGLVALVTPRLRPVVTFLDWIFRDPDHCHKAMCRSIDRAGQNNVTN